MNTQDVSRLRNQRLRATKNVTSVSKPFNPGPKTAPMQVDIDQICLKWLRIDWSNLTVFNGRGIFFDEFLELFRLAPLLDECSALNLKPGSHDPTQPINGSKVTHSLLCKLCIAVMPRVKFLSWVSLANVYGLFQKITLGV